MLAFIRIQLNTGWTVFSLSIGHYCKSVWDLANNFVYWVFRILCEKNAKVKCCAFFYLVFARTHVCSLRFHSYHARAFAILWRGTWQRKLQTATVAYHSKYAISIHGHDLFFFSLSLARSLALNFIVKEKYKYSPCAIHCIFC